MIVSPRVASVPLWIRSNLLSTKFQKVWRKRFPKNALKTQHQIPQKKRTRKRRKRIKHLLQNLKLLPKLQRKLTSLMIWVQTCRTTLQKKTLKQRDLWPLLSEAPSSRKSSPKSKRQRITRTRMTKQMELWPLLSEAPSSRKSSPNSKRQRITRTRRQR